MIAAVKRKERRQLISDEEHAAARLPQSKKSPWGGPKR
jgi:hypothetical protein